MSQKKIPGTPAVSPVGGKVSKARTPMPPTPKDVEGKIKSQRAARPGHGPKNKGSLG
jgi:hypothetical protein